MIVLKRQLYSQLEQREYNIISDIYHSGIKRTKKKYIGRIRRSAGDKITKKLRNNRTKHARSDRKFEDIYENKKSDKVLGRKLAREANKRGIRIFDEDKVNSVFGDPPGRKGNAYIRTVNDESRKRILDQAKNMSGRNQRKIGFHIGKTGKIINVTGKYDKDWDTIAHEIGHDMNNDGKISKIIKRIDDRASRPKKYKHDTHKSGIRNEIGSLMNSAKNKLSKLLKDPAEYLEERNAWKNAEKLLKRNGATEEQLKQLKETRNAALKTYKYNQKSRKLSNLRKKIQIESNQYYVGDMPATSKKIKQTRRNYARMRNRE